MPLSESAEKSLNESARISNLNKARKQADGIQQEGERRQAENDYNAFVKEQAEIQKQIDEYEALNKAEEQRYQDDVKAKAQAEQKIIDDRNAIVSPYTAEYNTLSEAKTKALEQGHTQYWSDSNLDGVADGGTRAQGVGRSQFDLTQNTITKNYNSALDKISRDRSYAEEQYNFSVTYPGAVLGRSALNSVKGGVSISEAYKRQQNSLEAKRQAQRQTAINQSQSQLKNDSAKWDNTISTLAQEKEANDQAFNSKIIFNKTPTKAGDLLPKATPPARELFQIEQERPLNLAGIKSYQATQEAKAEKLKEVMQERQKNIVPLEAPRPMNTKSNAFLTKAPVYASSIVGSTDKRSDQAVYTFAETQRQQKELSGLMAGAKNSKEATRIKEEYQKLNPYVGTPQTANTKQGYAEQGVLIDLKLDIKKEDKALESSLEEPTQTKQTETFEETITTYNVKIGDRTITGIKNEETANKLLARFNRQQELKNSEIPEYQFEKDGKEYKPSTAELWGYTNALINIDPPVPTKADQILSNYRKANPLAEEGQQSGEITNPLDKGFAKGFLDTGTELSASVQNIATDGKKLVVPETFEGALISDLVGQGKNQLGFKDENGKQYEEARLSDYVKEKIKTSQGMEEMAGSVFGMVAVNYALVKIPGAIQSKIAIPIVETVKSRQLKSVAEQIAENLRIGGRDPATEKFIDKFPEMTKAEREKLRSMTNKETVGVEYLNSETALIKRGTETSEVQTPYILVKGKKDPLMFSTVEDSGKPGTYSKIIIEGQTNKRLIEINVRDLAKQQNLIQQTRNKINTIASARNGKPDQKQLAILKNKLKTQTNQERLLKKEIRILETKELGGGKKIANDLTQYPATRENIIRADQMNKLAQVGTVEKVGMEGLRKTPHAVIEKIETQQVKTGGIIFETEKLNPTKSMIKDSGAKILAKGEKNTDWTKPPTKPTTINTARPTPTTSTTRINLDISTGKGSNISVLKSGATQKRETLEKIIKNSNKEAINLKTNTISKLSSISVITSAQISRSIQGTGASTGTQSATRQTQTTQTQQAQKTEIKTGLESGSKLRTDTIAGLKLDLETAQKQRPSLDPKYSLITKPGLKDDTTQIPILDSRLDEKVVQDQAFELIIKQDTLLDRPTPIPEKTRTTTTTIRGGFPILDIKLDLERDNKPKGGKLKIGFYRYNVNTDSVGRYMEQAPDISTGKTRKVIDRIDRLERRINTPLYTRKETKKELKQYKREMQTQRKASGTLESRMYIPNVTAPKGKKAQKQLKKLGFKLNIF